MNAREVLDYLATRPEQEDTLEGLASWWMKSDKGKHAIDELEDILNLMLAKGELEKINAKKDVVVYKIRKRLNA